MSSVSLAVERENTSESRFKKTVENLISDSCSCVKCDDQNYLADLQHFDFVDVDEVMS